MPDGDPSRFHGLLAIAAFVAVAWLFSSSRGRVPVRIVVTGMLLQVVIALLLLRVPVTADAFDAVAGVVAKAISFADEGSRFVFGSLSDPSGPWGFVFAFRVLPVIVFFAATMAVLYQLRVMPVIVSGMAWCLRRTLGVTGTEALSTASNVLVGQTEAPLCVRPYLPRMTRSQLMVVMTGGFATIAGSVLAGYVSFLGGEDEARRVEFARHLLTASLMSAPAAFVMAKLLVPETEPVEESEVEAAELKPGANVLDAVAVGAGDGLKLALNVAAMLVAFVAILALMDWPIAALGEWAPVAAWRAEHDLGPWGIAPLLGLCFSPVAWLLGIPSNDVSRVGELLGTQIVATEFVAYLRLSEMQADSSLSPRSVVIATYALCGFANLPSIAVQIGGLGALAPTRRADLSRLAFRAMCGGAMACWSTAAIAGMVLPADEMPPRLDVSPISQRAEDSPASERDADTCGPPVPGIVVLDGRDSWPQGLRKIEEPLATLHNVFEIAPGLYSGSGPETEAELDALANLGIRTVISVDGARPKHEWASERGMRYVHLPIGYDTVDPLQRMRLVRSVRDLERPIYLHCHHGKHRGPAALVYAQVSLGRCDARTGLRLLEILGTSRSSPGLYAAVTGASLVDPDEIDAVEELELAPVAKVGDLAAGMAKADRVFDRLFVIEAAGWKVPAEHPDLVPAAETGILTELFRGMRGLREGASPGDDHERQIEAFIERSTALEAAIREGRAKEASAVLADLDTRCTACHKAWRNK
jgi:CNT family concentrative nucleoside transporter